MLGHGGMAIFHSRLRKPESQTPARSRFSRATGIAEHVGKHRKTAQRVRTAPMGKHEFSNRSALQPHPRKVQKHALAADYMTRRPKRQTLSSGTIQLALPVCFSV